ncbi:MAG: preprotein translocase subunit SecE [Proteobacteria bacterium]|nr:preprotein translocase subunit SecE [Pseudomonadota bacterium]MBU1388153.1 preprotein translocase subunit SecE [Pseudomonadota bacterium]MBU1541838.1 preprotein translocase subunit SecE [Pseudomonadota bacterium]MBU2480268.1 preprotein translocase subunit SecE [Pseudomonadota bacterium]
MSRIQKKKPVSEKLKQKAVQEKQKENGSGSEKPVAQKAVFSAKPEKNAVDAKISDPNFFQRSMEYLREVKVELKKVTWPTRKQTTQTTIVVIIFVFVVAGFLGIFDFGLSKLVQIVLT